MGPLEAMVFLDASSYFWTRRGISAPVHNEPAAGRAGGRGKDGKTISGHVFGRAGGRTGCQSYFWTRLQQNYCWARLRAGGRADRLPKLFLDASCYFWTRRGISARVHNEPAGGRAREGWQNYFWTRRRASGRADMLPKIFLDTSSAKLFLGTSPGGRAGGRTGWQSYFWTRLAISGRVVVFLHASCYFAFITSGRPGGRAREGWQKYFWTRLRAGGRAGGQAAKVISRHVFRKNLSGHVSRRPGGRARKGGRRKILEVSSLES